jgi:hypothetical protein
MSTVSNGHRTQKKGRIEMKHDELVGMVQHRAPSRLPRRLPILIVRPAEMIDQHPQAQEQVKMVTVP